MSRYRSSNVVFISLLALCLSACAGEDSETGTPGGSPAGAPPPVMGSFEMGGVNQEFRVTQCDLTGTAQDGIFLRATGAMPDGQVLTPDGRRLSVTVERLTLSSGMIAESARVQFGSLMDEDGWEAAGLRVEGTLPLIEVSGNELVVAATYKHASRDDEAEGTLRVTCPAPVYP